MNKESLILLLWQIAICYAETNETQPNPIYSHIERSDDGSRIVVDLPQEDDLILYEFVGVDNNGEEIPIQGPDNNNELIILNCELTKVKIFYIKDDVKTFDTVIDIPANIVFDAVPRQPVQQMINGMIQLTEFQLKKWGNRLKYFYMNLDVDIMIREVPDDGIIMIACNNGMVEIFAENECHQESTRLVVFLNQTQCPPAPEVNVIGSASDDLKLIVDKPEKDVSIWYNFLFFTDPYVESSHIRTQESNEINITECGIYQVVVWYDYGKNRMSITKKITPVDYSRPQKLIHERNGKLITVRADKNSMPFKGYLIRYKEKKDGRQSDNFLVKGPEYKFVICSASQVTIRGIGECNRFSNHLIIDGPGKKQRKRVIE